jgi:hypothetical protein
VIGSRSTTFDNTSNHPDASVKQWTALDARQLLEQSGYTGR